MRLSFYASEVMARESSPETFTLMGRLLWLPVILGRECGGCRLETRCTASTEDASSPNSCRCRLTSSSMQVRQKFITFIHFVIRSLILFIHLVINLFLLLLIQWFIHSLIESTLSLSVCLSVCLLSLSLSPSHTHTHTLQLISRNACLWLRNFGRQHKPRGENAEAK